MRFVLRMAVRELRASWARLAFFFICIAIGVASIIALRSIIQSVRLTLTQESKAITAADVVIRTGRPWSDHALFILDEKLDQPYVYDRTRSVETATMVRVERDDNASTMVELRAIEAAFPYYGNIELTSGDPYDHSRHLANRGALVRPELLTRLDVEVGDTIRIGEAEFTIRETFTKEAGRNLSMFVVGPRVFIDYAELEATGLLQIGSRVSRQILVKADDEQVPELVWDLRGALANDFVRVRSFRQVGNRLSRRLARGENYLALAGFVILIIGGIGVWSVVRVFVAQRLKSAAILKCLGASSRQVLATYVFQVLGLALLGSLLGVVLARIAIFMIPPGLGFELEDVVFSLKLSAVLQGVGIGLIVSALFALIPLLEVRRVRPLLLLRPGSEAGSAGPGVFRGLDGAQLTAAVVLGATLVALAVWQAGSLRIGAIVSVGFIAVTLILHATGIGLMKAVYPLSRKAYFPLRHAVLNVSRPGNQTRVILLAVGLGCFFVLTVRAIESNLLEQFAIELQDDAPDIFFIDIQPDQVDELRERAERLGAPHVNLVPVLRARVVKVDGVRTKLEDYQAVRERGGLGREYTITFRNNLESNERIVDGQFWGVDREFDGAEVSIEVSFQERHGIEVGDTITFNIMGREIPARVTSLREVEWSDARNGGFMFVFRPEGLAGVPNTFAGFVKGPSDTTTRVRFQRELSADFANVSIIDLRDILALITEVVEKISLAVTIVGAVALFSGALMLVGSVAMTKYQRRYETAIFRTLGASKRRVATMMLLEYGTLGALAGLIGAISSVVMSWALTEQVFEIPFRLPVVTHAAGIAIATVGVSVVGLAVTLDVLRHKPLSILRAE